MSVEQATTEHKTAVILETRNLVKRCLELEHENQEWQERYEALEKQMENDRSNQWFIDFAQSELQKIKQRIQVNIRAIEHHTGSQDRLEFLRNKLMDDHTSPDEIQTIDKQLTQEVLHMYPSEPCSKPQSHFQKYNTNQHGIQAFRFAGSFQ